MFAANYLLVLRSQGRVEDDTQLLLEFNEVVDAYIRFLISTLTKSNEVKDLLFLSPSSASVEMISYYIAAGLVGRDDQLASFAFFMENILDDALQTQLVAANEKFFTQTMLEDVYTYGITVAIYGEPTRSEYLRHLLRQGDQALEWRSKDTRAASQDE